MGTTNALSRTQELTGSEARTFAGWLGSLLGVALTHAANGFDSGGRMERCSIESSLAQ
jgi:hypothetical protein